VATARPSWPTPRAGSRSLPPDLDHWLAGPILRTRHRREAEASPERLWQAAGEVTLAQSHLIGRIARWRIPGLPADRTFRETFRSEPFMLLAEGGGWSLSGLCGRIWHRHRAFTVLDDPEQFRTGRDPGTVRVLLAHWVERAGAGRAALVSEVRVDPVDRQARLGLRMVRPLIVASEHLIGAEPLALACAAAADSARTRTSRAPRPRT
jgi:hypothetical protein